MFIGHKVVAVPTRSLGEPDYFMHPDYQFKKSTTRGYERWQVQKKANGRY